jgi:uroporphyrinogen-III decarboxylase
MAFPKSWRSFDLSARLGKIESTFDLAEVTSAEDVPILINTPCYFAFATYDKPEDYFTNPASMVGYQEQGYQRHLSEIDDDLVPYFMPWFGTGVLASAFGCEIALQPGPGNDPAVAGPCITSPSDVAKLKLPDPHKDGWMPRVLETVDYARAHSDLPVGLTDMQGPLDTVGLMCGQEQLFMWMYEEPQAIHDLFDIVTEAFIEWVKVQKEHIGEPLDRSNGLQGVGASPVGVWESDDDMIMVGPKQYREFVVPYVSRIFEAFGGGSLHFCGKGFQHLDNILAVKDVRVVNVSPMAHHSAFGEFRRGLGEAVVIQLQDIAPIEVEDYYRKLFAEIDDLRGVMLAPFVVDGLGMQADGGYVTVEWEPFEVARRIVDIVRECIGKKLSGEPLV